MKSTKRYGLQEKPQKHPDSAPLLVLDNVFSKNIIPLYNQEILSEYNEVLRRSRFSFNEEDITLVIKAIITGGIDSQRVSSNEIVSDPKDIVFFEVAMSREDSYLVTGNIKHFPSIPRVVTPNEILEIIKNCGN